MDDTDAGNIDDAIKREREAGVVLPKPPDSTEHPRPESFPESFPKLPLPSEPEHVSDMTPRTLAIAATLKETGEPISKNADLDPQLAARRELAVSLKLKHLTYRQIGTHMGISAQAAWKLVQKEMKMINRHRREKVESLRTMKHLEIEEICARLRIKATPNPTKENPNPELNMEALNMLAKYMVIDCRVMGIEEPKRLQIDINEMRSNFSMIIERVVKVIPEESAPLVMEVLDATFKELEAKQAAGYGLNKDKTERRIEVPKE